MSGNTAALSLPSDIAAGGGGRLHIAVLVAAVFCFSALVGLVAAFGSVKVAVLVAAAVFGSAMLALPTQLLFSGLFFLSFLLVGQLFYFGGFGQAVWISFGLGGLLFAKWILAWFDSSQSRRLSVLGALAGLFLFSVVFSAVINLSPVLQAVAGGKNLVGLWGVFLVLGAGLVATTTVRRIWKSFFWILLFQVPVVVYQYFVVAPSRTRFGSTTGGVEWDAVVGGFGGDPDGGGYSGGMAFFVCVAVAFAVACYRRGLIGAFRLWVAVAAGLVSVGLAEVKVVVVLVPVAAIVMLAPHIKRRPLIVMLGIPVALVAGVLVLFAYESLHYGNSGTTTNGGPAEIVERAFSYSLDPEHINYRTREMGRVAALKLWWQEHSLSEPGEWLFGHGPGASRGNSIVGAGEAARRYPFLIDRSAATQLLWDVGIIGFLAYMSACMIGALKAAKLASTPGLDKLDAAILESSAAGLAMLVIMMFYGRDPLEAPAVSVLIMLMLGYVVFQDRRCVARVG